MIDNRFLESFLRLNNVGTHASVAEIKTVLTEAHWPKEEIEEALTLRSGGAAAVEALANKPHEQIFRPDMDWSSSKLSSLLGIDVVIDPKSFRASVSKKEESEHTGKKILTGLCLVVMAVAIAIGIGVGLMYFFEVGAFSTHAQDSI